MHPIAAWSLDSQSIHSFFAVLNSVGFVITAESGLDTSSSLGFRTGMGWVGNSHTVPVPVNTVPVTGTGTSRPVISTVYDETRGYSKYRGYFYYYFYYYYLLLLLILLFINNII